MRLVRWKLERERERERERDKKNWENAEWCGVVWCEKSVGLGGEGGEEGEGGEGGKRTGKSKTGIVGIFFFPFLFFFVVGGGHVGSELATTLSFYSHPIIL